MALDVNELMADAAIELLPDALHWKYIKHCRCHYHKSIACHSGSVTLCYGQTY